MSGCQAVAGPGRGRRTHAELDAIVAESLADPWGVVSPGLYDTAVLVRAGAQRPGLLPATQIEAASRYLLDAQNQDGSWGPSVAPAAYRVVPTLAATVAICTRVRNGCGPQPAQRAALVQAMRFLAADPDRFGPAALPDTVACEYLVPALLLDLSRTWPADGAHTDTNSTVEELRPGFDRLLALHGKGTAELSSLRARARTGRIPRQLLYTLEVFDEPPRGVVLFRDGHTGCSPSATATALCWVGRPDPSVLGYVVTALSRRGDGSVPHFLPMATFERAWIATNAARLRVRLRHDHARRLHAYFAGNLVAGSVPMGPGLPADADITAVTLYALGAGADVQSLYPFETARCFVNYLSERTASTSTNAHVLEALCAARDRGQGPVPSLDAAIDKVVSFLLDAQRADGAWTDKWHGSPYYATTCAVIALARAGGEGTRAAIVRAARWLLNSQRADGSWGLWTATLDETAHAIQALLATGGGEPVTSRAMCRGGRFLAEHRHAPLTDPVRVPLWHSKELYEPTRIINALVHAVLVALGPGRSGRPGGR
jgi:halimadienyl-diphosphate synthase